MYLYISEVQAKQSIRNITFNHGSVDANIEGRTLSCIQHALCVQRRAPKRKLVTGNMCVFVCVCICLYL